MKNNTSLSSSLIEEIMKTQQPISSIHDIKIGERVLKISHQFDAANIIVKVSNDILPLKRDIAYFSFAERGFKIPTEQQFQLDMKTQRKHYPAFAIWQHEIDLKVNSFYRLSSLALPEIAKQKIKSQKVKVLEFIPGSSEEELQVKTSQIENCSGRNMIRTFKMMDGLLCEKIPFGGWYQFKQYN